MYGRIIRLAILGLAVASAPVMADRESVPVTNAPGLYPTDGVSITTENADVSNFNRIPISGSGKLLIIASYHPDPGTDYATADPGAAITITSRADPITGRSGDISDTILPWESHVYGPFAIEGWRQSDGYLYCAGDTARVSFSAIVIP